MILKGGRKHTVALCSLVALIALALLDAPAEYAYSLAGMSLGFFGAHGAQDIANRGKPQPGNNAPA